ncbi:MAG: nitroreductase family protein [Clostridia bacterium]|nr:nitroreductase family protein [Clostridia bacterium]
MQNIYELIKQRTSIRSYKKDTVPMETVLKIIEAASLAPSWANKQCWRFIVVDSQVEKNIIGRASGQHNIAKACEEAPYILVLCADPKESGVKNGMEYYLFDCALAMENLVLAAQNEGLSTCIIGWFDEKAIKAVLNAPEHLRIVAFTPLGYSNEQSKIRSRKKPNEVIYHNLWGNNL